MEILLLTRESCTFCDQAKEILDRLTERYDVSVSTVDLSTPEGQRLADQAGVMFPPGILIDGEAFSYGRPSERKLRREIERRIGVRAG
ncbi:MAG: glutaredoxin family protein [Actinomycetota bacterium]